MNKKEKPFAACTRCGKSTSNAELINENCNNVIVGKKCKGVYRSALQDEAWRQCSECDGTGINEKAKCLICDGSGWIVNKQIWR